MPCVLSIASSLRLQQNRDVVTSLKEYVHEACNPANKCTMKPISDVVNKKVIFSYTCCSYLHLSCAMNEGFADLFLFKLIRKFILQGCLYSTR